jgi:hypothetical protein
MYGSPWQTKPGVFISGSSWLPQRGKASLQQKILLWNKKPVEFALSDIDDIAVKSVGRPFRRDNPSQGLAQAHRRDHRPDHRGGEQF